MTDPLTIKAALSIISSGISILKRLADNTSERVAHIDKELDALSSRLNMELSKLDELAEKADDVISRELGASFRSILDAAGSHNKTEFMSLLSFSCQGFTKLFCINPNGTTRIQGRLIPNSLIASLGYYGRHVYFAFTGRPVDALRQVYECTLKYPQNGIFVFE
jgi:hypothetical protein